MYGDNMLFDDLFYDLEKSNEKFYGVRTIDEDIIYGEWQQEFSVLDLTPFYDANLLRAFLTTIPSDLQYEYVKNTCGYHSSGEYDPNFVIVTRRAVPSDVPKPESFWSTEHRKVVSGLKNELPFNSPQRLHSVIMVTTLGKLEAHGLAYTDGGATDGEISIIPTKPFSDFLFMYKPENEMHELLDYLENGGMSQEELLDKLRLTAEERIREQGFVDLNDSYKR